MCWCFHYLQQTTVSHSRTALVQWGTLSRNTLNIAPPVLLLQYGPSYTTRSCLGKLLCSQDHHRCPDAHTLHQLAVDLCASTDGTTYCSALSITAHLDCTSVQPQQSFVSNLRTSCTSWTLCRAHPVPWRHTENLNRFYTNKRQANNVALLCVFVLWHTRDVWRLNEYKRRWIASQHSRPVGLSRLDKYKLKNETISYTGPSKSLTE